MHETKSKREELQITTRDGVRLGAILNSPVNTKDIKAGVLISSGTAYPKEFYQRFAQYGASRGYACLTYDYRGISASAPDDMRNNTIQMLDWGLLDAPAALEALIKRLNGLPAYTLGHSFGGQLIGLMDNHHLASAHALIAVGNGCWRYHWPSDWWKEFLFFYIMGPLSLARHGYLKGGHFWPGDSLPAGVFLQWRRWCNNTNYYRDEIRDKLDGAFFTMKDVPMRQFAFTDDPVVNPRSEPFTKACYKGAEYSTHWINPADLGLEKIGHSGAFSRSCQAFWPLTFDWFDSLL